MLDGLRRLALAAGAVSQVSELQQIVDDQCLVQQRLRLLRTLPQPGADAASNSINTSGRWVGLKMDQGGVSGGEGACSCVGAPADQTQGLHLGLIKAFSGGCARWNAE